MAEDNEQAKPEEIENVEAAGEAAEEKVEEVAEEQVAPEVAEVLDSEELLDNAPAPAAEVKPASVADAAKKDEKKKGTVPTAVAVLLGIVAVAAIAAAIAVFCVMRVPDGVAAKIGENTYLSESDVTEYIDNYRTQYSMTDDSTWAASLSQQSTTPSAMRINIIQTLAKNEIILAEAKKQNCAPTDDEIQEQLDSMKTSMASGDDETWNTMLEQYGYTEDELKEEIRISTARSNLLSAAVPKPDGYDDAIAAAQNVETDSDGNAKKKKEQDILDTANDLYSEWNTECTTYISNLVNDTSLTIYPMPSGLSYDVDLSLANSTDDEESTEDATESTSGE